MNGYERIWNCLNGKEVDRTPAMLHNFMAAASEKGYSMKEFRNSPKKIARAFIDYARKYDLDGIMVDIDTCIEAYAIGVKVDFPNNEPARVIGNAGDSIEEILEKMDKKRLYSDERVNIVLEAVSLMKEEVGGEIFIRGNADQAAFSLAMLSYGIENFMMDLLDEECNEDIHKLINKAYEVHLEYHKMMKKAGADITSFGDSSCGPDLISRDCYLEFSYPYHKRLKEDLEKEDIKTICHICGNMNSIIEDVASIKFAGLEVDYKTDINLAQRVLKGKSIMFGPIDPSGVFYFAKPEEVSRKTKEVLSIFKGEGIVIGSGCALPANTPEANIRAFINEVKRKTKY